MQTLPVESLTSNEEEACKKPVRGTSIWGHIRFNFSIQAKISMYNSILKTHPEQQLHLETVTTKFP